MSDVEIFHVAAMPPETVSPVLISQVSAVVAQPEYQVRMTLAGHLPRFIAHFRDESAAEVAVNSLKDLNLVAFTVTESELRRPVAPNLIAHSVKIDAERSVFMSRDGKTETLNAADVFLILTGRRTVIAGEAAVTTTTMKVNLPATLLSGGIPVMKRVVSKTPETRKTTEQFIRLYLKASDIPAVEIRQFDFDYSFLGEKKGPTATGNIIAAAIKLRQIFAHAYYNDSLFRGFAPDAKSISGIDLGEQNCRLLIKYYRELAARWSRRGEFMCRNIRILFNFDPPATEVEIRAAAEQFVRKISGFAKPSPANERAFDRAVEEVSKSTSKLLASLVTEATPRNREVEAAKRHARALERFGGDS